MYCDSIRKRDHAQESPFPFLNLSPKPETVLFLRLNTNRVFNDTDAHGFGQIWTLAQDLILKILGELIIWHAAKLTNAGRQ